MASCPCHTHRLGASGPSSLKLTQNNQAETHDVLQDHFRGRRLSSMKVNCAIACAVLCPVSPSDDFFFSSCSRWYERRSCSDVLADLDSISMVNVNSR